MVTGYSMFFTADFELRDLSNFLKNQNPRWQTLEEVATFHY